MLSATLHIILAVINIIGAANSYLSLKKDSQRRAIKNALFLFFIFFIFFHLSLSLPYLFFGENPVILSWGYNVAVLFLFLLVAPMYNIVATRVLKISEEKNRILLTLFFLAGIIIIAVQSFLPAYPRVLESGFIIWGNNFWTGLITMVFGAFVPILWAVVFFANRPEKMTSHEKVKAALLTAGTLMFSAASIYFIARNQQMVLWSFIFIYIGTLLVNALTFLREEERHM